MVEIRNQGREFKTYKKREERKKMDIEGEKGRKNERKQKGSKKLGKTLVKKFRLRHTLDISYGKENSAKHFRKGRGGKKSNFSKNLLPCFFLANLAESIKVLQKNINFL